MLLVSPDNHLTILEPDGIRHPFDPTALRDCLLRCFLNAGMSENCYLAEELALAIEYAFTHSGRADGCFGRGELDLAVVRVLEDAGLAPVAACYRAGATGIPSVECQVEPATVGAILRQYLAGGEHSLDELRQQVIRALRLLDIHAASPALLVELGRYYAERRPGNIPLPPTGPTDRTRPLLPEELLGDLPPTARRLTDAGVIRIAPINRFFPSIRLFCHLQNATEHFRWPQPTTEMLLAPDLARVAQALDLCHQRAAAVWATFTGNTDRILPVYLTIADIRRFAIDTLGATPDPGDRLLNDIARLLTGCMQTPLEKVMLN